MILLNEKKGCENFCWSFSPSWCVIKVTIEADQREVILLSRDVLISIVKIELELFNHVNLTLSICGTEAK